MEIQTATIVPGTESPAGDGLNGAIRCIITLQDGSKRRAVVKRGMPGNILAEVFAAFLLRGWGLSVPDPFLIHEDSGLAFASADIQYPNLKQAFNFDAVPDSLKEIAIFSAVRVVCSLPSISLAAACDETIDNRDRNLGNVLWDGETESWIDHAFALGHGAHMPDKNKLCDMAREIPELTQNIQRGAVASALCLNRDLPREIQDILDRTPLPSENTVDFISERLASIGNRIIARFPQPVDLLTGV